MCETLCNNVRNFYNVAKTNDIIKCKRKSEKKIGGNTSILHDVEERRNDSGDGFQLDGRLPSSLSIHHCSQCIIQYPPTHLSLSLCNQK